jgi:hypothetical protein
MKAVAFRSLAAAALLVALSRPAFAQEAPPAQDEEVDATKMGVSLGRIQKGLRLAESAEEKSGSALRLNFQIQVYGQAPKIDVLKDYDLINGQVPGSPPTHRDIIEFLTPPIFRTPGFPIAALVGWVAQAMDSRAKKANCEAELRNYRALLMQGVNVAAPRCTQ